MSFFKWKKAGLFVAGMIFSTKGIELIKSKSAHNAYVIATAAALRGRDEVMEGVTSLREGCEDIYAEAVEFNEQRALSTEVEVEVIEDKSAAGEAKAKRSAKAKAKAE